MGALLSFFQSAAKMELCIVGLENAGKSTLMNVLASGDTSETVPTVGLNVKVVKKGGVTMKMWDLAGQSAYRSEWSRYARGVDAIVFVVDVADVPRVAEARRELHRLLEDTTLAATPILIAANKVDILPHMPEQQLIKELNLDYLLDNPWIICPISAKHKQNLDVFLTWRLKQRKGEATRGAESGSVISGRR
jgi:Arf/Sar family protein